MAMTTNHRNDGSEDFLRPDKVRVLVIEDHDLVRKGILAVLAHHSIFTVCGQAEDASAAEAILSETRPDVVLLDLSLRDSDGMALLKLIKSRWPEIHVLIFSGHDDVIYAPRALAAGALGYITKTEAHEKLIVALQQVARGDIFVSDAVRAHLLKRIVTGKTLSGTESLSDRELQIFTMTAEGKSPREIAETLNVSIHTVSQHLFKIKNKLNVATRRELVLAATQRTKDQP